MENEETHDETQGQANHEATSLAKKLLENKFLPILICRPFEDEPIDECNANIRSEGNCILIACSQTQTQNQSEPNLICYDCKKEFPTKK